MKAITIAKSPAPMIASSASIKEAIPLIKTETGCALAVVDGDRLVGTISKDDLLKRVASKQLDPDTTTVRDVMKVSPATIGEDVETDEALKVMLAHKQCYLPIVDTKGQVKAWLAICHLFEEHVDMLSDQLDTLANLAGADSPGG